MHSDKTMAPKLKLYCAWFCPFAQRAWIALLEKGLPFEYVETNPYEKSPELMKINPKGLVPVIVPEGGLPVYESDVCIQYIDELDKGGNSLMPQDPNERAQVRIWCEFLSAKIVPLFYRLLGTTEPATQDELKKTLLDNLATFSAAIDDEGPFFYGKKFGMVDMMLCPFSLRFDPVLKHYRDFEVPDTDQYRKLRRWMTACHEHPSVTRTIADSSKITKIYSFYAEKKAMNTPEILVAMKQIYEGSQ